MKTIILILTAVIAFTLPPVSAATEDPVAKGGAVAREWDRRDRDFDCNSLKRVR